jgi:3-oxoacyl-[acyl-carrier-protein] synthase III
VKRARIAGIEYVLPKKCLTNAELDALHPDWNMPEVAKRTGVVNRHIAGEGETALDLAVAAAERLKQRLHLDARTIDGVIFSTQTPDYLIPGNAASFQHRLGLPTSVFGFDLRFGCAGFVYGLFLAKSLIESGAAENILLATSETVSQFDSPDDRATVSLFGDAAAVTLLTAGSHGVNQFAMGTDGSGLDAVFIPGGGSRCPRSGAPDIVHGNEQGYLRSDDHLFMNGVEVLTFFKRVIPPSIRQLLHQSELTTDDVSLFVFHQASGFVLDYFQALLKLPPAKVFRNLENIGNTSSASIPIALRDAELQGRLKSRDRVLLSGFGAGWSWGSCIVDW